jgi:hypothetical protein
VNVGGPSARNLADLYNLPLMSWEPIAARLETGFTEAPGTGGPNRFSWWMATINPDGTPLLNAVGALWADGAIWFTTGSASQKARNLEHDPRCTFAISAEDFDVAIKGRSERVTDPELVAARAKEWAAAGWPCEVDESGVALTAPFSAPSAGPPPWFVYRVIPLKVTALLTVAPGGATTWTFESEVGSANP